MYFLSVAFNGGSARCIECFHPQWRSPKVLLGTFQQSGQILTVPNVLSE